MKLTEMFDAAIPGFQDVGDDNSKPVAVEKKD